MTGAGGDENVGVGEDRGAFAGWPMIIGWLAMLIFAFHACTHMVAAGDTWVAMACGRHFVNHGVDTVEPFSANSHAAGPTAEEVEAWPGWAQWITDKVGLETVKYWHPTGWVNQNWLTHVIFYSLTTTLGSEEQPYYNALVLWKIAIYMLAAVCLYFTTRIYGANRALAVFFVCFAMFIGRSFFDVRPAGFSNLLVAVFLLVLACTSYRNGLYAWLMVPLIVFWANVHGGYVYAFIVLTPFVLWHAIMNLPKRWALAVYSILTWVVLYGMASRFLHHEHLKAVSVSHDWGFYLVLVAIAGSILLARHRQVSDSSLTAFHVTVSFVLFLLLLTKFFVATPVNLGGREEKVLLTYISSSRLAYAGIFSFAAVLGAIVVAAREKVVRVMPPRAILHTAGAGAVAFVAMVVFNPFHLTNLTHTFIISLSSHAERWRDVHEWHRAFDWSNPVGTAKPFLVMYILAWLVFLVAAYVFVRLARAGGRPAKKRSGASDDYYEWPKMDLSLVAVAALTVYMAIRSRRFIPIAGFAACPIVALLLDQILRAAAALAHRGKSKKLEVPPMAEGPRAGIILAGAGAVFLFGLFWGMKFKRIYLDYWPADPKLASVFMRMTASDAKPFYACEFIRQNRLSGKMFNYWTEGGFIAWGQQPDPETGRTPLQLFMDGRAQAAYDVAAFDRWTTIMAGGPVVRYSIVSGRSLTSADYIKVGNWISEELRKRNVWVVLMPTNQFNKPFTKGLEHSLDWRIVFISDKQKLFVDVKTPQGMKLYEGMFTGQTLYPDEYLANLSVGHNLLLFDNMGQKKKGLALLEEAFKVNPSPAPILDMLLIAIRFPELRPRIDRICTEYAEDFAKNKETYSKQDGYNLRLEAARLALLRLEQIMTTQRKAEEAEAYRLRWTAYEAERNMISMRKRW